MSVSRVHKGFEAAFVHESAASTSSNQFSKSSVSGTSAVGNLKPFPVLKFHNLYISSSSATCSPISHSLVAPSDTNSTYSSSLNSNSSATSFASSMSFNPIVSLEQKRRIEARINIENSRRDFGIKIGA
jgi:hypothetical protein